MAKKKVVEEEKKLIGVVKGDRPLNIRSSKTTDAQNIVGCLQPGTEVEILTDGKLWLKIADGFIMREFVDIQ